MATRAPLIAGNWKMHLGWRAAIELARGYCELAQRHAALEFVVFPSMLHVAQVAAACKGERVEVGGQNCHAEKSGAFTGEVSPEQLLDCGATTVLLGHSERRNEFGEPDGLIERKLTLALECGLRVVFCAGETLEQRDEGETLSIVARQLAALERVKLAHRGRVDVAYEPVWAIGTGRTAMPQQAGEVHREVRRMLEKFGGYEAARVLYGGSVKPDNASALAEEEGVEGFLVGGASLKLADFAAIAARAEKNLVV